MSESGQGLKAVVTPILIPVDAKLCEAYRDGCQKAMAANMMRLEGKVDNLKNLIVGAVSLSTAIISIILLIRG